MLAFKSKDDGKWRLWNPQTPLPLNGSDDTFLLPPNIEEVANEDELARYSLARVVMSELEPLPIKSSQVIERDGKPHLEYVYEDAPPPDTSALRVERDKRLSQGFVFDNGRVATDSAAMAYYIEMAVYGVPRFIERDGQPYEVDEANWGRFLSYLAAFRNDIFHCYFALLERQPIPSDYRADKWWPNP